MPPKRGRPAASSNVQSAKRIRVGTTTVIGGDPGETAPSGRPKRESVVEHNYSDTRRNATSNGASKAKTETKPNVTKKREPASAPATQPEKKRGRPAKSMESEPAKTARKPGRPPKSFDLKMPVAVSKPRGRPPKKSRADASPTAEPAAASSSTAKKSPGRPTKAKRGRPAAEKKTKANGKSGKGANKAAGAMAKADPDQSGEESDASESGRQYWLMKAEPETRIEQGRDVKFSINDLAAAKKPEAWDGVRNYQARNHMRAMRVGDLAFFYHSNCKVPGIAGIMNIVGEHTVDDTAFDPKNPYYDAKSSLENPKWDVVHVSFHSRFADIIPLTDLRSFGKSGGVLEEMPLLKSSRLSVSPVTRAQWRFIMTELAQVEESGHQNKEALMGPTKTNSKDETEANGTTLEGKPHANGRKTKKNGLEEGENGENSDISENEAGEDVGSGDEDGEGADENDKESGEDDEEGGDEDQDDQNGEQGNDDDTGAVEDDTEPVEE